MATPSESSKTQKPIRLGFIGLSTQGWAAAALVPPLLQAPLSSHFSIAAVSTTNPVSAEATAKKYSELTGASVKPYHGSVEHMVGDKDVDMVVVSVRVLHHKEVVSKVIEGGKDLFIEWPVGRNLEETREIYEAAMRKQIKVIVGLQTRFTGYALKTKSIIDNDDIGKVVTTSFTVSMGSLAYGPIMPQFYNYLPVTSNGATLVDITGGHLLDMFTYILGPIASLSALLQNQISSVTIVDNDGKPTGEIVPQDGPNQVCIMGVLASGAVFNINIQSNVKETDFNWVIHGEKGTVRIRDDNRARQIGFYDATPDVYLNGRKVDLQSIGTSAMNSSVDSKDVQSTPAGLAWQAVVDGKAGEYATLEQALKVKEIVAAVHESAKDGKRISF